MGEYAFYRINGVDIYSVKNEASTTPVLMEVFAPGDWLELPEDDAAGAPGYLGYKTTCRSAKRRLDVQGFTYEKCLSNLRSVVESRRQLIENPPEEYGEDAIARLFRPAHWAELLPVLENEQGLLEACRQVLDDNAATEAMWFPEYSDKGPAVEPVNALAARLFSEHCADVFDAWPFGYDEYEQLDLLRVLLEASDEEWVIEYDCTLPMRYWAEGMADELLEHLNKTVFSSAAKVFVLTEGKTDDEFLSSSFELLRPEISHLFKFFDCHLPVKAERSADALAKFANSIIAAGLKEKFLFVFDNDAVGIASYGKLPDLLPENMKRMHLPDCDVAKNYPTFGPDGLSTSDLNGRAVAIEFFLGDNALKNEKGERRIVKWKECHSETYQGSFEKDDKDAAHAIFREAVEDARRNGLEQSKHDWEPMEGLLDLIAREASDLKTDFVNW